MKKIYTYRKMFIKFPTISSNIFNYLKTYWIVLIVLWTGLSEINFEFRTRTNNKLVCSMLGLQVHSPAYNFLTDAEPAQFDIGFLRVPAMD